MLYKYLGEQVFRDGLRLYIKKFAYSNAETQDLWNALGEASGQNINEIMGSWTKQMGFPLIVVKGKFNSLSLE
jgi:aminopeptidase N